MQFFKLALASVCAFAGLAASQVIITITSTVTVTPKWTSTYTAIVTVTKSSTTSTSAQTTWTWGWNPGFPSPKPSTVVSTVYVTAPPATPTSAAASDPNATRCPVALWYQCGGSGWKGCNVCERGYPCQSQNEWYYQCIDPNAQKTPRLQVNGQIATDIPDSESVAAAPTPASGNSTLSTITSVVMATVTA
ncbi:hypothetical protein G7Y89_g10941 [Cudoniella acicularis]|uniref:CBM1 domain-containing protein n=1 Tax=Cudoniella acicularis TaxID=354080 RepID=A0A8H4RBS4_9HELO|nr:hypothetical protein G7Y89_g10941 [Cudoniella acicularis]